MEIDHSRVKLLNRNRMNSIIFLIVSLLFQNSICSTLEDLDNYEMYEDAGRIRNLEDLQKLGLDLEDYDENTINDTFLTTPQLLVKYGYPLEIHKVETSDGYILEMHRIPNPGGIPVYLQHGLMDSSGGWVIMGPKTAFAYLLADKGYDVWMGNIRGNRYSKRHKKLKPKDAKFWDFSFSEVGAYDLPAMVDYIIEKTEYKKIHYAGHSQGTTSFFVMCIQSPNHCKKILSMQAMAPIAYMEYVRSPLIRAVVPFLSKIEFILKRLGAHEFMPNNFFFKLAGQALCRKEASTATVCQNAIFLITGYNSEQLNQTMLPVILGHIPAGASIKQLIHYGQLVKSGEFFMYDYGKFKNFLKYGKFNPPLYDLRKVTAPVALHYSRNDWLAGIGDVKKLLELLPNVITDYLIPDPKFNHMDFLLAMNTREMVQHEAIEIMKRYENEENFE